MSCPNIYFGTGRFGAGPLPAEYGNDAIVLSSYDVIVGATVFGEVHLKNHGTDDSPVSHLELYWSDPGTNFPALPSRLIFETDQLVPGTAIGDPTDEEYVMSWSYAFPTVGHYCLLARVDMNSVPPGGCTKQGYSTASPPTDPQSAIHNINVVTAAPKKFGADKFMGFGFMAVNMQKDTQKTFLEVHALNPGKDREKLLNLVSIPAIDRLLSPLGVKFAVPAGLHLGDGRERILYRREHFAKGTQINCVPRIGTLGEVDSETIKRLLLPGTKLLEAKGKHELDLLYGEARQTFIQIEASGRENVAYAVEVTHKAEDGRVIGGLTTIFVPPHDYF
ncbi:MAG TPA: hypothetical protein VGC79_34010 [Polyangiaceae bacterium]